MGKVRGGVEENLDFLLFYFTFWAGSLLCKTFNDLTNASYGELWPARSGQSGILRKIERERGEVEDLSQSRVIVGFGQSQWWSVSVVRVTKDFFIEK